MSASARRGPRTVFCERFQAEPTAAAAALVAVAALIFAIISLVQSEYVEHKAAEEGQKTTLAKLIAEIVNLNNTYPATAGSEEAEIGTAEVALPLAEMLHAAAPTIDFYEIGRALAMTSESPGALRALQFAASRHEHTRPRAFALREEAAVLYRMGGPAHVGEAEHDIYVAKHMFDDRGEPLLRDIDYAYTDLFDVAEGPKRCVIALREISEAKRIVKHDGLQRVAGLIARREEAKHRERTCKKATEG